MIPMLARITDVITDPLIGYLSDRTNTRYAPASRGAYARRQARRDASGQNDAIAGYNRPT